ncbi:hypothetical protein CUR178_03054 [Leishmania enriettii]|uniref:Uncharacterized protein n=1 Tax=Leishmania enriettii TaxID=5663 RepID=A0A836KGE5_LEIEN|nr:hypothetical protein CUR178_03054 [Leishmania enriettii]
MRRLVFVPSCYGLAASWRACVHPSHSLLERAHEKVCHPLLGGHLDRKGRGSKAANHGDTVRPSHTNSQQRSCSGQRRPLMPLLTTPCSIGGTPFQYLLQRIIEDKAEKLFHKRLTAFEFLCNVATLNSTTPCRGSAAEEAEAREQQISIAFYKAWESTMFSFAKRGRGLPITVCLQRPEGHVCVPEVVGETYLFLRSHGVDVAAWWERYYTVFIRPGVVGRPGGEDVVEAAAANDRGTGRATAAVAKGHRDPSIESNSGASPPPFYWKLKRNLRGFGEICETSLRHVEMFALPLPSFEEPLLSRAALPKAQFDALARGGDGVPTSMSEATTAFASPPARQLVWIPVYLLLHLPFFPIPFPSVHTEGDLRQAQSAKTRCGDAAFASAGLPLTSREAGSWVVEQNERVLQQREEDEPTEVGCLLPKQGPASLPNSADDALLEAISDGRSSCFLESLPQYSMSTLRRRAHTLEDQLIEEQWGHPFFDNLQESSDTDMGTLPHPSMLPSYGDKEAASHDGTTSQQGWWNYQRVRESSTFALDLVSSQTSLPATTATGALFSAAAAEWPSPLWSWQLRGGHWKCLSSFWATKTNPVESLAMDYSFPFTAYLLLRYRALRRAHAERSDLSTCKPHLCLFSPWSNTATPERRAASTRWGRSFWRECCGGPRRSRWGARSSVYIRDGEEGPKHQMMSTMVPGGARCSRRETEPTRMAVGFETLLDRTESEEVMFFGVKYVSAKATALSCLFDSTACVRHAVPLHVTGAVFVSGLRPTRYRQQHSCLPTGHRHMLTASKNSRSRVGPATHGVGAQATMPQLPFLEAAMQKLMIAEAAVAAPGNSLGRVAAISGGETGLESTSAAAPWLVRLREIRNECQGGNEEKCASKMERVVSMRSSQRANFFLFQSPYWVEVTGLYERWGVCVAPGVVPLLIDGESYVNAEQTTDASRFTPRTCVPHLQQEVLFSVGLGACTWAGSQHLLNLSAPGAAPRRRPGGVCAWTYSSLCERAAAVQQVSNLWIAESVIERFKWTLRAAPAPPRPEKPNESRSGDPDEALRGTLPLVDVQPRNLQVSLRDELEVEAFSPQCQQRCGSSWQVYSRRVRARSPVPSLPCEPPAVADMPSPNASRHTGQLHCSVVHSSCVVEQAELQFVAEYSPFVLLMRTPELTSRDWGFDAWKTAEGMATTAARLANTQSAGSTSGGDTARSATGGHAEGPKPSYGYLEWEGDDGDEAFTDDSAHGCTAARGSVSALKKHAEILRRRAVRRKRSLYLNPWRGAKLTFRSRLDLSHLALRKGYSPANAFKWVSLDFLRDEPRVRAARTSEVVPKVNAQPADETELAHPVPASGSAAAASSAQRKERPPSTSHGITAIEVDVLLYSRSRSRGNNPSEADGGDIEYGHGVGNCDDADTYYCSTGVPLTRIALINYEELDWPDSMTSSLRERWVGKHL